MARAHWKNTINNRPNESGKPEVFSYYSIQGVTDPHIANSLVQFENQKTNI